LTGVFFGPSFPQGTYNDFVVLDDAMPILMSPLAFTALSAKRARARLLQVMMNYITDNGAFADEKVEIISSALRSVESLPLLEKSVCLLSLVWSINATLLKSTWWMMGYLAVDANARDCLVDEMAMTLPDDFKDDISTMLTPDPDVMFRKFPLFDAAVTETLRLCTLPGSVRVALADTEISLDGGGRFLVRAGDLMMADTRPQHFNEEAYPDPLTFKVDRFLPQLNGGLDVPKVLSWGMGIHMASLLELNVPEYRADAFP
jgi:cytochrome P450